MKTRIPFCLVLALVCVWLPSRVRGVELRTVLREEASGLRIEYWSGDQSVGRSPDDAPAGVQLRQPGEEWMAVRFRTREERDGVIELGPTEVGGLTLRWRIARKTPSLVERTLEVHAGAARQFAVGFPFETAVAGEFASFTGPVSTRTLFDTVRGSANTETFPVVMLRTPCSSKYCRACSMPSPTSLLEWLSSPKQKETPMSRAIVTSHGAG